MPNLLGLGATTNGDGDDKEGGVTDSLLGFATAYASIQSRGQTTNLNDLSKLVAVNPAALSILKINGAGGSNRPQGQTMSAFPTNTPADRLVSAGSGGGGGAVGYGMLGGVAAGSTPNQRFLVEATASGATAALRTAGGEDRSYSEIYPADVRNAEASRSGASGSSGATVTGSGETVYGGHKPR